MTDYDQLVLEVWTNGSIRPDEAVSVAAKILIEHLQLFVNLTEAADDVEIMVEKDEEPKDRVLSMTIEELDLSVRSYNCLKRAGINTVEELIEEDRGRHAEGAQPGQEVAAGSQGKTGGVRPVLAPAGGVKEGLRA